MAEQVLMPRQGNTVESCIIVSWKKKEGDKVKNGEAICEVETDKATFDVESTAEGILLKILFDEGEDVPVLIPIAVIGKEGEDISDLIKIDAVEDTKQTSKEKVIEDKAEAVIDAVEQINRTGELFISPRARLLADKKGVDVSKINGTGPDGRIIERDIERYFKDKDPLTKAAMDQMKSKGLSAPVSGSGIGGRILTSDLFKDTNKSSGKGKPLTGIRKIISEKMHYSLQSTAQVTLNASADASVLLESRKKFKNAENDPALNNISINDLIMFAVVKALLKFKEINAHLENGAMQTFDYVNLGFALDTQKGLMVPVIKNADKLSLKDISGESKRLISASENNSIQPDELSDATFTITNLGALGIESFTPILNSPEIGILGVCSIQLKPVMKDENVEFIPHIGLSLTFNHQAIDGAPAARFVKTVIEIIENLGDYIEL